MLESAVFAAAQHGQRSFKQARELLRQKKTNRKFFGPRKFPGTAGKGPGSQASTRGQPSTASTTGSKRDSEAWKTDPNTMCLRCGGYGHIAKNCKSPAKLQHGRRYKNPSSWSLRKRLSRIRTRITPALIRSSGTRMRTTSTQTRSRGKYRYGGRRRQCRRDPVRRFRTKRVRSSRSGRRKTCIVRISRHETRCVFVVYEQCVYMVAIFRVRSRVSWTLGLHLR